jgi:hypothetical protein
VSVGVFTLFFILLLVAGGALVYLFIKNRRILNREVKTGDELEKQLNEKRMQLEEH